MFKKIFTLLPLFLFLLIPRTASAFTPETFVTITNPVRGPENWVLKQAPLDVPVALYKEASQSGLPSNWLLRYDAVTDATISGYFNELIGPDKLVSLGGFLEITPNLTQIANVRSHNNNANMQFLSGYTQKERILLIDTFMNAFKNRFGFYPKSVGASHLDSYSLRYLQEKYSVLTAMIIDDQYASSNIALRGGYLGSPYFPDKNNSLIPASDYDNRVNLAVVRWAQRDLFNILNPQPKSSYSIHPDDYLTAGQNTSYFEKLLSLFSQKEFNQFTYVNVGLENDTLLKESVQEIPQIFSTLKADREKDKLNFVSLAYFGNWMLSMYPESSPLYFYRANDSTGKLEGEVYWYQSPYYRIGLKSVDGQTKIIDFRIYNRNLYEDYFATPNQNNNLLAEVPAEIDSNKFPGSEIPLNIDLQQFKTTYSNKTDFWKLTLQNENQKIIFTQNSIIFSNISIPVTNLPNVRETTKDSETVWLMSPQTPFSNIFSNYYVLAAIVFILIILCFLKNKLLGIGSLIAIMPLLMVFKDNRLYPFGLGYWGSNAHDAIFHLSIIEKIAQNPLDLSHPQLAGEKLSNYHFVFDYLSGLLVRFTQIPSFQIYFFFMPLAMAVILTYLVIKLLKIWKFSHTETIFSLVFINLCGSLGFIPSLLSGHGLFTGESAFWANQSISLFLNPPYALSLIVLVSTLLFLEKYQAKKTKRYILAVILLGGLLSQTKVYSFILFLGGLLFSGQWFFLISVGFAGALLTLPFSSGQGFPFEISPFWFIKSMFASGDRLNLEWIAGAWQAYEATGSFIKLVAVTFVGVIVFLLGNIGTRIIGIFDIFKNKKEFLSQKILVWMSLFGILIPLVFTQKYNPWNSIQFLYYSLFVFGLFSGRGLSNLINRLKNRTVKLFVLIIILTASLLTTVGSLKDHTGFLPTARVSYSEIEALTFLKTQPGGTVLAPYFDGAISWNLIPPKPLYAYSSTAYISALSGKQEYLSDTINLDITGFDYKERAKNIQRFYNTKDVAWAKRFLSENNIKYVYVTPFKDLDYSSLSLTKIFDSGEIKIYQTN